MSTKHEDILSVIRRFEYFKNFSDEKISECSAISKIEQFDPQEIIFSQSDIKNFSYFVLSGKCMILQCLKIRDKGNGRSELVVLKKSNDPIELAMSKLSTIEAGKLSTASIVKTDDPSIKLQFADVGTYNCGGVFGIGEEMENRMIIAKNTVQCLLIPRHWLFQKTQNIGNVWQRIKLFLNSSIPSQQQLYKNHLANRKWKIYKKRTLNHILIQKRTSIAQTQYHDIPVVCRVENS